MSTGASREAPVDNECFSISHTNWELGWDAAKRRLVVIFDNLRNFDNLRSFDNFRNFGNLRNFDNDTCAWTPNRIYLQFVCEIEKHSLSTGASREAPVDKRARL